MKEFGSKFKQKYKSLKNKVQPVGFCLDQVKEIARQQNINSPVNGLVGSTGYIALCQKLCSVLIMTIRHSSYYPLSKASWLQHENLCNSLSIIQWELIRNSSFTPSHHCILCHFHPASKSSTSETCRSCEHVIHQGTKAPPINSPIVATAHQYFWGPGI